MEGKWGFPFKTTGNLTFLAHFRLTFMALSSGIPTIRVCVSHPDGALILELSFSVLWCLRALSMSRAAGWTRRRSPTHLSHTGFRVAALYGYTGEVRISLLGPERQPGSS
jgi:hypothetical protein